MKKTLFLCMFLLGTIVLHAQYNSDYDVVKSATEGEVIWKGDCTFEDIEKVPAFRLTEQSKAYIPDQTIMPALAEALHKYDIVIFLGTWCEDSHRLIPQLYRVLEDCGYPLLNLRIFALDRDKKGKNGEEIPYHITNVPTIIILQHGEEKGRITETVKDTIEGDLAGIVAK